VVFCILFVSCKPTSSAEQTTADADTVDTEEQALSPGMGTRAAMADDEKREAIYKLPEIKLPYKFTYAKNEGIDVSTSVMSSWLTGAHTEPIVKRAIGVVETDSALFILWTGALTADSKVWRAYVTVIVEDFPAFSAELDAVQNDLEKCDPTFYEHWTVVNEYLECRSLINIGSVICMSMRGEYATQCQITNSATVPKARAHLFKNIPVKPPMPAYAALGLQVLTAYEQNEIPKAFHTVYFPDYDADKVTVIPNLPAQLDTFRLMGVWRTMVDPTTRQNEMQLSYVCAKQDKYLNTGFAAIIKLPGAPEQHLPNHTIVSDRYLKVFGEYYNTAGHKITYLRYFTPFNASMGSLSDLSMNELRIHRNYLFAKRGYIFKDQDLREYVSTFRWYKPLVKEVSEKELTEEERELLKYIQAMEKEIAE
jgi:hypothetical protein